MRSNPDIARYLEKNPNVMCDREVTNTTKPGQHKCSKCTKSFKLKDGLTKHMEIAHEKKKQINCNFCSKSFKTKTGLQSHVETTHENQNQDDVLTIDEPFVCKFCKKNFITKQGLKVRLL